MIHCPACKNDTWINRLARKTISFSKLELMDDTVIGLPIKKVEFGINIFT